MIEFLADDSVLRIILIVDFVVSFIVGFIFWGYVMYMLLSAHKRISHSNKLIQDIASEVSKLSASKKSKK